MKKPILIDDLINQKNSIRQYQIQIKNLNLCGWRIAKPLTLSIGFFTRIYHAFRVLIGKAHAFTYFDDLSQKDRVKHIETEIKKHVELTKKMKYGKIGD